MTMATTKRKIFEENFSQMLKYVDGDGKLNFPNKDSNARRLKNWCCRQKYRKTLSCDEQRKLESIGYDNATKVDKNDVTWESQFSRLLQYKEEYNTLMVSKKDKDHVDLRYWIAHQRRLEKDGRLSDKRKDLLIKAGFIFEPIRTKGSKKAEHS